MGMDDTRVDILDKFSGWRMNQKKFLGGIRNTLGRRAWVFFRKFSPAQGGLLVSRAAMAVGQLGC